MGKFVGGPLTLDDTLIIPHGAGKEYCNKSLKLDGTNEFPPRIAQGQDEGRFGIGTRVLIPDIRISCNLFATEFG